MVVEPVAKRGVRLTICVGLFLVLRLMPVPEGLPAQGWHVFAVFLPVILGFILRPLPTGPLVLCGLVLLSATQSMTLGEALSGYGDTTVWLVVAAFLVAGAVVRTGFGRRVALFLVVRLGRSMTGLGYALCGSEMILGPVIPSNTARGGGVLAPITRSLCEALDSRPHAGPEKAGTYLSLVGSHANLIAAAMYLTGMAANPLVARAASDVFGISFGWGTWALGAILPALVAFATLPLVLRFLAPPTLVDVAPARERAKQALRDMGPWSRDEKVMATVFLLLIALWASKPLHGMGTSLVAWIGVCVLFLSGAETYENMMKNHRAWDTLIWLGGLLAMANGLKDHGFIDWFVMSVQTQVSGIHGLTLLLILALVYFYSMYAFSMLTAHISAMTAAFFALVLATGAAGITAAATPLLTVAIFAYFSNLCGCLTNYSSGPVIVYYGLGYVPSSQWFRIGFIISIFHLVIWLGVGLLWWRLLGWW